jgi:hypothetical protein
MALDPTLKITFQDEAGDYYVATQDYTGAWSVTTTPTLTYLKYLPLDWDKDTVITWQRNMDYGGVFRSMTDKYVFGLDGRAILQSLMFGGGGVNAYCLMTIYLFNETTFNYDVLYPSEIDFTKYNDDAQNKRLNIGTIDNGLLKYFESKRDTEFNIPFWTYDGSAWSTDAAAVYHDGIKLYWEANFVGGENTTTPFGYNIRGWNEGRHGTGGAEGMHTLPALANKIIPQNNGSTTFIGNDILSPILRSTAQQPAYNEVNFVQNNNRNISYMSPIQPIGDSVALDYTFNLVVDFASSIIYTHAGGGIHYFLSFVLFEINPDGEPSQTIPGLYDVFQVIEAIDLGTSGTFTPTDINTTVTVSLNAGKAYMLGIIFDGQAGAPQDSSGSAAFTLYGLELNIKSVYNSGTSTPVNAPTLPPSGLLAYTPMQVFKKIMDVLDSTETDAYGFPVPTYNYSAISDFLINTLDPADNFDLQPKNLWFTSENMMRNTQGIPYMTISLSKLFNFWNRVNMLGLGFYSATEINMEYMSGYFNTSTEILDLGSNIYGLDIKPYTSIMGNKIHGGYGAMQTNNDFGGDNYNFGQEYNLPLDTTPKTIDYSVDFIAEINQIEKLRQQNNSNSNSPSSNNNVVVLQVNPLSTEIVNLYNPEGGVYGTTAVLLLKFANAQSTDPTAATDPYVNGLKYPDTAYNLGITPAKNFLRMGGWVRTMCDGQDVAGKYATYRKQYQQIYGASTSPATSLPGISTKIYAGLVNEVADIELNTLNSKFFRPYIFTFTTEYPVNMYQLLNTDPYGYVKFVGEDGIERKGFLYRIQQSAGNNAATTMELLATPDMTDLQLRSN